MQRLVKPENRNLFDFVALKNQPKKHAITIVLVAANFRNLVLLKQIQLRPLIRKIRKIRILKGLLLKVWNIPLILSSNKIPNSYCIRAISDIMFFR